MFSELYCLFDKFLPTTAWISLTISSSTWGWFAMRHSMKNTETDVVSGAAISISNMHWFTFSLVSSPRFWRMGRERNIGKVSEVQNRKWGSTQESITSTKWNHRNYKSLELTIDTFINNLPLKAKQYRHLSMYLMFLHSLVFMFCIVQTQRCLNLKGQSNQIV